MTHSYLEACKIDRAWVSLALSIIGPVSKIFSIKLCVLCLRCSKEPFQLDGSFEYPQYMFCLRNKKIIFRHAPLFWGVFHAGKFCIPYFFASAGYFQN